MMRQMVVATAQIIIQVATQAVGMSMWRLRYRQAQPMMM